jgi:hypothetical protein
MIACLETKNGYPAGPLNFAGLGAVDPQTAMLLAQGGMQLFSNASGQKSSEDFFSFARGSTTLAAQTRKTGIVVAGVAALAVGGLILWAVLK